MNQNKIPGVISVAAVASPEIDIYSISNDGKQIHVFDAVLIRLLSQIFGVPYKVLVTPDGEFGQMLPNGTWSGLIGMVRRSEADLAVGGVGLDLESFEAVNLSHPYIFSDLTFVTDKLKPLSTSLTLLYPFNLKVWILIAVAVVTVSFFIYIVMYRRQSYEHILFTLFGSLLEESTDFKIRKTRLRFLLGAWFIFILIVINSYKSILLSFLTVPSYVGIRDIPALAEASEKNSMACYTFTGSVLQHIFLKSGLESWKSVGKCLERNPITSEISEELFMKAPPKKSFIGGRVFVIPFAKDNFLSEDSFFNVMYAIPFSRKFCCKKYLDEVIHHLYDAGLFQKHMGDEHMALMFYMKSNSSEDSGSLKKLGISDLGGAFLILFAGYILSFFALIAETVMNKYNSKSKFKSVRQ